MTQHDMDVANQGYAALRGDVNSALGALVTNNAGTSAPSTTFANMWWPDTTNGVMKQRNTANNAWNTMYPLGNDGMFVLRNAGTPQGALAAWFVGQLCFDTTNKQLYVATVADGTSGGSTWKRDVFYQANLPTAYRGSLAPTPNSGTSYSIATIMERDKTDTYNIIKTSNTTLNLATTGLNGIATSANLAGTIGTGGASSTTITGSSTTFLSDFIVGDFITCSAGARVVTAIANDGSLTVDTAITITNGSSYWRGGATGIPLSLYAIYKPSDGSVGLLASTRSEAGGDTLVDLPSGYTAYRQLCWCTPRATSIIGYVVGGWPWNTEIAFDSDFAAPGDSNPTLNSDNFGGTTFSTLETRSGTIRHTPKDTKAASFYISANSGAVVATIRPGGSSTNGRRYNLNGANDDVYTDLIPLNSSGQYQAKVSANSVDISIASVLLQIRNSV
jgi:hypothetical protein